MNGGIARNQQHGEALRRMDEDLDGGPVADAALTIMASPKVVRSGDPGQYYCNHVFFTAQKEAANTGSSVLRNPHGESLVGFLHIPGDAWTLAGSASAPAAPSQSERHGETRQIVGKALRGYYGEVASQVGDRAVRLLLTGFGPFLKVTDNPTGDFVTHPENVDAAMQLAFGADLITRTGTPVNQSRATTNMVPVDTAAAPMQDGRAEALAYQVRTATGQRTVYVQNRLLATADDTLTPNKKGSLPKVMQDFAPHAVLSMGVATSAQHYRAEYHADNGGLMGTKHVSGRAPTEDLSDNFSLERVLSAKS